MEMEMEMEMGMGMETKKNITSKKPLGIHYNPSGFS